jgi:hypothetical protein
METIRTAGFIPHSTVENTSDQAIGYQKRIYLSTSEMDLNPPPTINFGDQKPFRKKVSGLPKAFDY